MFIKRAQKSSFVIGNFQIKTTMRYYYMAVRMTKISTTIRKLCIPIAAKMTSNRKALSLLWEYKIVQPLDSFFTKPYG